MLFDRRKALAQHAPFVFGGSAPDARLLIGLQRIFQAPATYVTEATNGFGGTDLIERLAGCADREEQIRVCVSTGGTIAPLSCTSKDRIDCTIQGLQGPPPW